MKNNKFSQDDLTRQKQRAEELTKNIEDKIQKAREKQQKELEFKKRNNPEFRDYDREPIELRDYNGEVTYFWTLFIFIFILVTIVFTDNKLVALPFLVWIFKSQNQSKNAEFKFTNSTILHTSPKFMKKIDITKIEKIQKTMQIFYEIHNEKNENKFFKYFVNIFLIFWLLGIVFVAVVIENQLAIILPIFIIFLLGLFIPQILYHLKKIKILYFYTILFW